ncbi:carbon-nitrogen hydrolase [Aspergillus indologenus CBS 114.80]|uniref:nitrilase n=1 Tax=Aspergillus indologenus CBS 114.80 TaxID=1450541 RepID=A0A2V5IC59_9EURO|nr:carbon-nitrogen hydrolase [Aspergillus indologenus CBS 114.80]
MKMRVLRLLALGLLSSSHATSTHHEDYTNLTVAVVRAPPANWPLPVMNKNWTDIPFDLNATVAKAVDYIAEAASNGANLIVFPELWFPGYPKGLASNTSITPAQLTSYLTNSLTIPSPQWTRLLAAAQTHGIYIVPAFSHRVANHIFMAQALISPAGETLLLRHKLRPSGGERTIWSDGTLDGLQVIATPYGRWGLLECWEHFHPAMTFNVQAQMETLHIASWPYMPDENTPGAEYWESNEINVAAARTYAVNAGAPLAMAAVGNARLLSAEGLDEVVVRAGVSMDEVPVVYASFNTTGLAGTLPYDTDGEQSWGTLGQIVRGFPGYIPQVVGDFVQRNFVDVVGLVQELRAD